MPQLEDPIGQLNHSGAKARWDAAVGSEASKLDPKKFAAPKDANPREDAVPRYPWP
jgi:hypothetical protein